MLGLLFCFLLSIQFIAISSFAGVVPPKNHGHNSDSSKNRYVEIDNIFIIGNKVTKNKIILREMDVRVGSFYGYLDLQEILEADKNKIQNLQLFNTVEISILDLSPTKVDIVVQVKERWYTFPAPIFDLVDRNFNDWWQNRNGDLSRTNYGVRLFRNNFRGRNERLRLTLQLGFTRNFSLSYRIPQIDRAQRHGISFLFDYTENKSIGFRTEDHFQLFIDSEDLLRIERRMGMGYRFRNSFYTVHSFELTFNNNQVGDTIAIINPEYFNDGQDDQQYFHFAYGLTIDKRDFNPYPLKGFRFDVLLEKLGLGMFGDIDQTEFNASLSRYFDVGKKFYLSNYSSVFVSTARDQAYANFNALGFEKNLIRGYELYLIEASNYYVNRTTFKRRIFSTKGRIGLIPIEQFREFPLDIYVKTYFDAGYAENYPNYEQSSLLTNRFLFGTGAGLDIVTYYDTVFRFEYSINRENEAGLFFHLKKEF